MAADYSETIARMKEAAKTRMTPKERRAQMVSYAMGMMGKHSTMTREAVESLVVEKYGSLKED